MDPGDKPWKRNDWTRIWEGRNGRDRNLWEHGTNQGRN